MNVIGVFQSFFDGFGSFLNFMNTQYELELISGFEIATFKPTFTSVTFTPLTAFGVGIGAILTIAFALHVWHLIKLVF